MRHSKKYIKLYPVIYSMKYAADYDEVIVIGEWSLYDDSIERYVSMELIFGDQADEWSETDEITDEKIINFIVDYANDHDLIVNSYSEIYRDPFERASVNVIFEKTEKVLEHQLLKNRYPSSDNEGE
ncbi:hypothetical protein AAK882_02630 [Carnobacteriaceae bacterium 52-44]